MVESVRCQIAFICRSEFITYVARDILILLNLQTELWSKKMFFIQQSSLEDFHDKVLKILVRKERYIQSHIITSASSQNKLQLGIVTTCLVCTNVVHGPPKSSLTVLLCVYTYAIYPAVQIPQKGYFVASLKIIYGI